MGISKDGQRCPEVVMSVLKLIALFLAVLLASIAVAASEAPHA
jgi:hypothetical protein